MRLNKVIFWFIRRGKSRGKRKQKKVKDKKKVVEEEKEVEKKKKNKNNKNRLRDEGKIKKVDGSKAYWMIWNQIWKWPQEKIDSG